MSEMIPPAVIDVEGDDRSFVATVSNVKALLLDLTKTATKVRIRADAGQAKSTIATTKAMLKDLSKIVADPKIRPETAAMKEAVATTKADMALINDMVARPKIIPQIDIGALRAAWAKAIAAGPAMSALPRGEAGLVPYGSRLPATYGSGWEFAAAAAAASGRNGRPYLGPPMLGPGAAPGGLVPYSPGPDWAWGGAAGGASSGRSGRSGILSLLGGFLAARGGGGSGGVLSALGWGTGGLGPLRGMAGFGSVLGLAGFGAEHVVGSGLGLLGSLAGAGIGGGLLGLGALGTMGVGMGTDMAGIGQASNDIKAVVQAQDNLNQAIAVYGKNSVQAVQAQRQLNYTLSGFAKVARGAVLAAANTAQQFHAMFDRLTGLAEKRGALILNQTMKVGEHYLPTIGKFAAGNMSIIGHSLNGKGGLFSWLKNAGSEGGLGIFQNLERIFQKQLPTAMHAMTQGFELLAKVVNVAAGYTGGFVRAINKLFTRLNSPKSFKGVASEVGKLIGLFHSWLDLVGSVGKVIVNLFKPAVGFGKAFADYLRSVFDQISKFLALKGTRNALTSLFTGHVVEVVKGLGGALKDLLPSLEGMFLSFVKVEGAVVRVTGDILVLVAKGLKPILDNPVAKAIGGWGLAALLTAKGIGQLWTAGGKLIASVAKLGGQLKTIASSIASFAGRIVALVPELGAWAAGMVGVETESVALNAALGVGVIAGIAALGVGIYELATHWKAVWRTIKTVARDTWGWLTKTVDDLWHHLDNAWHHVLNGVHEVWNAIRSFLHSTVGQIVLAVASPIAGLVNLVVQHWNTIKHATETAWHSVVAFLRHAGHDIIDAFKGAGHWLLAAGKHIVDGLLSGLKSAWHSVTGWIGKAGHGIASVFGKVLGIFSPSRVFMSHGQNIILGLVQGLDSKRQLPIAEMTKLANAMQSVMRQQRDQFYSLGVSTGQGYAAGLLAAMPAVEAAAAKLAAAAATGAAGAGGIGHTPGPGLVQQLRGGSAY